MVSLRNLQPQTPSVTVSPLPSPAGSPAPRGFCPVTQKTHRATLRRITIPNACPVLQAVSFHFHTYAQTAPLDSSDRNQKQQNAKPSKSCSKLSKDDIFRCGPASKPKSVKASMQPVSVTTKSTTVKR